MKRWKRKIVSFLTFMVAAFLAAQLLLYLPGPTTVIKKGGLRSMLQEDTIEPPSYPKDILANLRHLPEAPKTPEDIASPQLGVNFDKDSILLKKSEAPAFQEFKLPPKPGGSVFLKQKHPPLLLTPQKVGGVVLPVPISSVGKTASNAASPQTPPRRAKNRSSKSVGVELTGKLIPKSVQNKDGYQILVKTVPEIKREQSGGMEGSFGKTEDKASNQKLLEGSRENVELKTSNQKSVGTSWNLVGKKDEKQPSVPSVITYRQQPQAKKWIVLDGGHQPCSDVTVYTAGQPDWHVMLVNNGDAAVKGCRPEVCQVQYVSDLNQAYLKAISYGAGVIVLADCLSRYPQLDQDFRLNDLYQYGMYYNATNMFNPYHYAGYEAVFPKVNSAWDRPINGQPDGSTPLTPPTPNAEMYFLSDFGRVSFRQGFRLGEDICACEDASSFDPTGEEILNNPVVVGDNTLVHLGTGPYVALPDAFYWLFVPRGLSGDALESFRTFWLHALKKAGLIHTGYFRTNALLASLGGDSSKSLKPCVNVTNPRTSVDMTSGNIHSPFSATLRTAFHCVQHTSCMSHMDETACATHLSVEVLRCLTPVGLEESYIQDHIKALSAWFTKLQKLKVPLPQPRPLPVAEQIKNTFKVKYNLNRQQLYRSSKPNSAAKTRELQEIKRSVIDPMVKKCPNLTHSGFRFPDSWTSRYTKNSDIALVVTVNYEFLYKTIAHVEFVHRQSFRFILYCGPNMTAFNSFVKQHGGLDHVTFIDGGWSGSNGWHTIYRCLTLVMKMRLPVKGYLQVGEDVLINSKNLASQPRDKVMILKYYSKRNLSVVEETENWYHWNKPWGREALINLMAQLRTSAKFASSSTDARTIFGDDVYGLSNEEFRSPVPGRTSRDLKRATSRFLENYSANIGSLDIVIHRATDFFFVPETWREDYIILAEIFQYTGVIIEFAFPMLHLGMIRKENANYVRGASLWREERSAPWKFYHENLAFLHPFKSMKNLETHEGREFFCDNFLERYEAWVHS
ncbi:hypothetical protein RRG08_027638 [Elysia crispata]|uniref:Uncharacterized protein n=1 Tax=Elysia crispata TaxID=231223 RepID=A0AAE1DA36_9GAST|nr:hypothetical protein RRG08_027638 [Elysia crispata]